MRFEPWSSRTAVGHPSIKPPRSAHRYVDRFLLILNSVIIHAMMTGCAVRIAMHYPVANQFYCFCLCYFVLWFAANKFDSILYFDSVSWFVEWQVDWLNLIDLFLSWLIWLISGLTDWLNKWLKIFIHQTKYTSGSITVDTKNNIKLTKVTMNNIQL